MSSKLNLLNFDKAALQEWFVANDEKPFRATQILKWIHQHGELDIENMTDVGKKLREKLKNNFETVLPEVAVDNISSDGTRKWLFRLADGNCVETVYIPEKTRATLCISSQVGCGLNCSFCATGAQGFNRNLELHEIIAQIWLAHKLVADYNELEGKIVKPTEKIISNVVFMGMGEPLLNYANVQKVINLLLDDHIYNLSKYRVTLSTSGVVPILENFCKNSDAALAISLHAPNNELRNTLVPINKKYNLEYLLQVCEDYTKSRDRQVTFEYVMLDGVNDTKEYAIQLVKILKNIDCKINLIPFNSFSNTLYKRSTDENIDIFSSILHKAGYVVTVRKTRGEDISAACGQLAGKFQDRTSRSRLLLEKYKQSVAS